MVPKALPFLVLHDELNTAHNNLQADAVSSCLGFEYLPLNLSLRDALAAVPPQLQSQWLFHPLSLLPLLLPMMFLLNGTK